MTTTTAVYERGLLKLRKPLALRNGQLVILRIIRKPDPVTGTKGIIQVSPQFVRELTKPHRYSALNP